jgi:alpha-ketoglutarate-dependent taurine dioxygenase
VMMATHQPLAAARDGLPKLIEPGAKGASLDALLTGLRNAADTVQQDLLQHGALLIRGFPVDTPADFERVARAIDDDLKNEYLGTSPRDAVTDYVFSASELPGFYPIPQHCEMTFTRTPPRRIFFWCDIEPAAGSGETPLVDFRKVWRDLPAPVRERFAGRGLRLIRNYAGPGTQKSDLWQLKRWDEMFQTTERDEV